MIEPATHFRDSIQAFLERTGTAPARLGADVLGNPSFVSIGNIPSVKANATAPCWTSQPWLHNLN